MEISYDKSSRTPVDRAFYESFIMRDRWKVTRLYAQNMSASVKFKKEVKHLGYQRKSSLMRMDNEIEKTKRQLGQFHFEQDHLTQHINEEEKKEKQNVKEEKTKQNVKLNKRRKSSAMVKEKVIIHKPDLFPVKPKSSVTIHDTNKQIKIPLPIVKESKNDAKQSSATRRDKISLPSLSMSTFPAILPDDVNDKRTNDGPSKKFSVSRPPSKEERKKSVSNDSFREIKVRIPGTTGMFNDISASADESGVSAAELESERLQNILEMINSNNSEVYMLAKGDSRKPSRTYRLSETCKPSLPTVEEIETIPDNKNNTEKSRKISRVKKKKISIVPKLAFQKPEEIVINETDGNTKRKGRSKTTNNIENEGRSKTTGNNENEDRSKTTGNMENEVSNISDEQTGDSLMQLVNTINQRNRSKSLLTETNKRKVSTNHPLDNVGDLEVDGKVERISIENKEPPRTSTKERKPSEFTTVSYSLSRNYNDFFKDEDFIETKAKYIPRDMKANLGSLLLM